MVDRGSKAPNQGREIGHVELSCLGSDFEISGAHNIIAFYLMEKDYRAIGKVGVPAMVEDGFVCLKKVGSIFLLPLLFSLLLLILLSPAHPIPTSPRAARYGHIEREVEIHGGVAGYRRKCLS